MTRGFIFGEYTHINQNVKCLSHTQNDTMDFASEK